MYTNFVVVFFFLLWKLKIQYLNEKSIVKFNERKKSKLVCLLHWVFAWSYFWWKSLEFSSTEWMLKKDLKFSYFSDSTTISTYLFHPKNWMDEWNPHPHAVIFKMTSPELLLSVNSHQVWMLIGITLISLCASLFSKGNNINNNKQRKKSLLFQTSVTQFKLLCGLRMHDCRFTFYQWYG